MSMAESQAAFLASLSHGDPSTIQGTQTRRQRRFDLTDSVRFHRQICYSAQYQPLLGTIRHFTWYVPHIPKTGNDWASFV